MVINFINSGSTGPHASYKNSCSEWAYEGGAKHQLCCVKSVNSSKHDLVVLPLEAVGGSFGSCQEGSIPSTITGIGHSGWGHLVTVEYAVLLTAEDIGRSSPIFVSAPQRLM